MQVKTKIKAGGMPFNHNETLVRIQKPAQGLKVKTGVKAGNIRGPNFTPPFPSY